MDKTDKLEACPFCPTEQREIHKTKDNGVIGMIMHDEGCYLAAHEDDRCQVLLPKGIAAWNSRTSVVAPPPQWYVATMNDCVFIVDRKPQPAPVDYVNPSLPAPRVVISMRSGSREAQEIAEQIVEAHNQ